MENQRQDMETRDRVVRLETICQSIERDVADVIHSYKLLADKHTEMFVEAIKTGTMLHSAIEKLSNQAAALNDNIKSIETKAEASIERIDKRVKDLERLKWKILGMATGALIVIQVLFKLVSLYIG